MLYNNYVYKHQRLIIFKSNNHSFCLQRGSLAGINMNWVYLSTEDVLVTGLNTLMAI